MLVTFLCITDPVGGVIIDDDGESVKMMDSDKLIFVINCRFLKFYESYWYSI